MRMEHLQLFLQIARTENITKAGEKLGLSAAVASAHVQKLEQSLNVKLLQRTTRQVSLTEEGRVFLSHAEEILQAMEMAQAAIGSGETIPKGRLRITAPASFGRMHIIPVLPDYQSTYPNVRIDLRLSDTIIDMVEGGFDVAIRDAKLPDSSYIGRKLARDQRIVVASPTYLNQQGTPETPAQLIEHACLHLPNLTKWQFETQAGNVAISVPSTFVADNGEALRDAAVAGMGITLTSQWCAYEEIRAGRLVQVLKDFPVKSDTDIWALYPSARLVAPKVRSFIDFLSDQFGESPYWEQSA